MAQEVNVAEAVRHLLDKGGFDLQRLGAEIGVAASTVSRWADGKAVPRALYEGRVRDLLTRVAGGEVRVRESGSIYNLPLVIDEEHVRAGLEEALREIREALHRRGRFSSRNEALDELCKLLFAHAVSRGGISKRTVLSGGNSAEGAAVLLRSFVGAAFAKHLPQATDAGTEEGDFALNLRVGEDALAMDIIGAFERLEGHEGELGTGALERLDVLNDAFGAFLGDSFVNDKELGQYLTPPEVVQFMVGLAIEDMAPEELATLCDPSGCIQFGLILDPSCGVASFLVEVVRSLRARVEAAHGSEGAKVWLDNMSMHVLVGVDKSERMIRLALANMGMSGLPNARLVLANSLARDGENGDLLKSFEGRARLILTNPPFGAEFRGQDLGGYRIASQLGGRRASRVDSEVLFIERYTDWLAPGGSVVAIVPDSILTNKGVYERLRKVLAERAEVRSVVSLPEATFGAAGTNTKTSVLHARTRSVAAREGGKCFVAVCNNVGYTVRTRNAQRTKEKNGKGDLPEILDAFRRKVPAADRADFSSRLELSGRWDAKFHMGRRDDEGTYVSVPRRGVLVSSVASLVDERTDPRRWGRDQFRYIEISDIDGANCRATSKLIRCDDAPSRARKVVKRGDVLVSTVRPERRTVGVVLPEDDGSVCSTGLAILRPMGIEPLVLGHLLQSDYATSQITRNTQGINYPAIEEECLLEVELPIRRAEIDNAGELAREAEAAEWKSVKAIRLLRAQLSESARDWEGGGGTE